MDAVTTGFRTDIHHKVARTGCGRIEDPVGSGEADAHCVDQNIAVIGGVELALAAYGRHADAIPIPADPRYDTGQEVPSKRMVRAAEAQRVEDRNRSRPHCKDIAQNATHTCRGALIRFDKRGVIVALDLENDSVAVADVDDAGILARAANNLRSCSGQCLEPDLRRLVRAVLAPHHREYAELGDVGRAAEKLDRALEFLVGQPVLGREGGGDVTPVVHWSALTNPSKKARPSVPPSAGSVAFSGCGISPSTVRVSLKIPAIARAEPLKLSSSRSSPFGPQ